MTNLTKLDTRAGSLVLLATAALLAGCDDDRASNTSAREPIAITESGIEILEVTRRMDERIVEAVIVAGGEERQVTVEPFLDGPLPSGVTTTLFSSEGTSRRSYGWDESTGSSYIRTESQGDVLELTRIRAGGRVLEEYRLNDQSLRLEYADLPEPVYAKITAKYFRGEPIGDTTPEVREFYSAVEKFGAFVDGLPLVAMTETPDGELLTTLFDDQVFTSLIVGEEIVPDRWQQSLCNFFTTCFAIVCRFQIFPNLCTTCGLGSLLCAFLNLVCDIWCA